MDVLKLSGKTLKSYDIDVLIGEGGYGVVYRAIQKAVAREVAIKVILPHYANSPEFIRRFESEAQVIARLEHPHIVPLIDFWREPDSAFLVMRYLRGGSLRDRIDEHGALRPESVSKILEQVAGALTFAHRNGVIHRDIKADNILLDEDGNAYLGDFGIAKELGSESNLTQDNVIGTPAYIPPEQIRGEQITPQSDVYTFGIMLYEILTGRRPFTELTPMSLLYKHLKDPLPMIDHNELNLPSSINAIIQRATAKDPSVRYPDTISLVNEFQQAIQIESEVIEIRDTTLELAPEELEFLDVKNPYKGLRAFQQADSADFFGRSEMIDRILGRLAEDSAENEFLAVIGPSGSGKSSLVKAGVIPALRRGEIEGSENWFFAEMTPGKDPLGELEVALLSIATSPLPNMLNLLREGDYGLAEGAEWSLPTEDGRLVLLIDQFEEIFTQLDQESDRELFLNLIHYAVMTDDSPVKVIVTLRADFYDKPLLYPEFGELIRKRTELVLPLSNQNLEESITGPATHVGASLEEGLVQIIVDDVREQPGALPLLQYALTELFERRDGPLLTIQAYEDIGGTFGALAQRAEDVYRRFDETTQKTVRQIFLRLVTLGDGQEDTRRRVLQSELFDLGEQAIVQNVIDRFGRYRLLTFDHDDVTRSATVEVAHEALIRQWERFRDWLDNSREDLRLERRLLHSANEWVSSRRDKSYLLQGTRLQQFQEWVEDTALRLNLLEVEFLETSLSARTERLEQEEARKAREEALEKRTAQFLRIIAGVLAVSTLIAVGLSVFAFSQRNVATEQQLIAETERERAEDALETAEQNERKNLSLALAANSRNALIENEPALALPIALEANAAFQPPAAEILRILGMTAFSPGPRFLYDQTDRSVLAVASDSEGVISAYGGVEGVIYLVNNATGNPIRSIDVGASITGLSFSPDGTFIAGSLDDNTVGVWLLVNGTEQYRLAGHTDVVSDVEFSPDGTLLASSSGDHTVRIWDIETGEMKQVLEGDSGFVFKISFSPDGTRIVSSTGDDTISGSSDAIRDRKVRVWDIETGELVVEIDPNSGYVRDVEFSPDGQTVASASWDSANGATARIYHAETGVELHRFFAHRDNITNIEFNSDGTQLVTASWDKSIKFWDIEKGVELRSYIAFGERIIDIEFTPNNEFLLVGLGHIGDNAITADEDNPVDTSVWLWDLENRTQSQVYYGHTDWTWTTDISPDGKLMASGSGPLRLPDDTSNLDTTVRIWDIETGQEIRTLQGHTNTVDSVKFTLDGDYLLSASWDGTIKQWDVITGQMLQTYEGHDGNVYMLDMMPNGEQFISASADGTLKLWDIQSGEVILTYSGHEGEVNSVNISPDGVQMLSGAGDKTIRLWDIESGEEIRQYLGHESSVNYAKFAPNMEFLISTSWDDTVRRWDVETGEELYQYIGHTGNTFGIAITKDSQIMLTTSSDTTVRMWDIESGEEINRFNQHSDWIQEVVFSPNETFAISAGQDNTLRQWQIALTSDALVDWAKENRYIRELTCAERETLQLSAWFKLD
jgi:WD40 repeat protein/serine/threonine protein kinase